MIRETTSKSIDELEAIGKANAEINYLKSVCIQQEEKIKLQNIALNTSINSTTITDQNGNIIWVNDAFTKLTGYSLEESVGQNPRILKSGVHSKKFYKDLWKSISSGKMWKGEITNKKKNGTLYHEKITIYPVLNSQQEITNYIASKQDITGQKLTDAALDESYIKYEELAYIFNQSPAIGFLLLEDKSRTVEFVTDNIKQWNYTPEDFYSQKLGFADIIFENDRTNVLAKISNKIKNGREIIKQQYRIVTKDGEIRWVDSHMHVRLGDNNSVTHLQGVVLDVTERKMAEEESKIQLEQLMQADKMIALGTLVSGVAHEINNPNNFVMLNIPLIEKVWFNILPILEKHYDDVGDFNVGDRIKFSKIRSSMPLLLGGINEGSQRIKTIVEDLKSFARKDASGYNQNIDLNEVVQTSINLTANLVSKSTDKFVVKYTKEPVYVKGNKQKLEQILINLIENSCQALSDRRQGIKIEINKNCENVNIKVSDDGSGIKPEILRNITDPFFTTKRNKGGTGLGLSIASKIITQHKGKLNIESELGNGTCATIILPLEQDKNYE